MQSKSQHAGSERVSPKWLSRLNVWRLSANTHLDADLLTFRADVQVGVARTQECVVFVYQSAASGESEETISCWFTRRSRR